MLEGRERIGAGFEIGAKLLAVGGVDIDSCTSCGLDEEADACEGEGECDRDCDDDGGAKSDCGGGWF